MSWIRCSKADNYTEDGGIDTTGVDYICQGCDTEREAKASIRRFRALGYELYEEETGTEYAGNIKNAYGALSRFAVRNNFSDCAGYRLSFRRERGKYKNIKGMIEYEQKLSRASAADIADIGYMRKVLRLIFAVFAVIFVVVFIVALIAEAAFNVDPDGTFSLTIDVLFWFVIGGVGVDLIIGIIYGLFSKCGFAWHYRLSRLKGLVKKNRKQMEFDRWVIGDDTEEATMSDGLGVVDNQNPINLASENDKDDKDWNKRQR